MKTKNLGTVDDFREETESMCDDFSVRCMIIDASHARDSLLDDLSSFTKQKGTTNVIVIDSQMSEKDVIATYTLLEMAMSENRNGKERRFDFYGVTAESHDTKISKENISLNESVSIIENDITRYTRAKRIAGLNDIVPETTGKIPEPEAI